MFHDAFVDHSVQCIAKHSWLSQVYEYFSNGEISADTLITALRWVLDNLC